MKRSTFLAKIQERLAGSAPGADQLALILVRLNHLKEISHTYGFDTGERVLDATMERLTGAVRAQDLVVHLGGSSFALLLGSPCNPALTELAINRMLQIIEEPLRVTGTVLRCHCHGSGALYPDHAGSASDLLVVAEKALEKARAQGGSYLPSLNDETLAQTTDFRILENVASGIGQHEFELVYQPQVGLGDGVVQGVEALIRWNNLELGHIPPGRFIPLVELSEVIVPVTRWTFNAAMRDYQAIAAVNGSINVSVNVSAPLLTHPELHDIVGDALAIWGMPPERLMIEITETAMLERPEASIASLHRLREFGVRISIDDFGTGYSSLAYLEQLPTDELKIDMSFVRKMANSDHDRKIIRAIIDLAHTFDMKVVAEGIEDAGNAAMLHDFGCDFGQGYYFSRPLAQEQLLQYLGKQRTA